MNITNTGAIKATSEENRIEIINTIMGIKATEIPMEYRIGSANENNFFISTFANFEKCEMPTGKADFESNSGSKYFYSDLGVTRISNHFGQSIASCSWLLNDNEYQGEEVAAFCNWEDFIHIPQQCESEFGDTYFSTFASISGKDFIKINENERAYF